MVCGKVKNEKSKFQVKIKKEGILHFLIALLNFDI